MTRLQFVGASALMVLAPMFGIAGTASADETGKPHCHCKECAKNEGGACSCEGKTCEANKCDCHHTKGEAQKPTKK